MWFEELTGFREETPEQVRENLSVDGAILKSQVNGAEYICGHLETPTLGDISRLAKLCKNIRRGLVRNDLLE